MPETAQHQSLPEALNAYQAWKLFNTAFDEAGFAVFGFRKH
jgi:predicted nucleotide-binding protein (sugar kinase/HSP70/actin superfamily)